MPQKHTQWTYQEVVGWGEERRESIGRVIEMDCERRERQEEKTTATKGRRRGEKCVCLTAFTLLKASTTTSTAYLGVVY